MLASLIQMEGNKIVINIIVIDYISGEQTILEYVEINKMKQMDIWKISKAFLQRIIINKHRLNNKTEKYH